MRGEVHGDVSNRIRRARGPRGLRAHSTMAVLVTQSKGRVLLQCKTKRSQDAHQRDEGSLMYLGNIFYAGTRKRGASFDAPRFHLVRAPGIRRSYRGSP